MKNTDFLFVIFFGLLIGTSSVTADSTYDYSGAEFKSVEKLISQEKYNKAIEKLSDLVESEPDNADAWNLLGYASRKQGDLKQSAFAYKKALSIDSQHKDALEYQGELFLMLGDKASAEANLAKLKTLCPDGCEQAQMLMDAIAAH